MAYRTDVKEFSAISNKYEGKIPTAVFDVHYLEKRSSRLNETAPKHQLQVVSGHQMEPNFSSSLRGASSS